MKLIRRKYLLAQIDALTEKDVRSSAEKAKLKAFNKELEEITEFLDDAKAQRDAILQEICMNNCSINCSFFCVGLPHVLFCQFNRIPFNY